MEVPAAQDSGRATLRSGNLRFAGVILFNRYQGREVEGCPAEDV